MKNAIPSIMLLISLFTALISVGWYVLRFLWDGLINTHFPVYTMLYAILGIVVSVLLMVILAMPLENKFKK